MIRLLYNKLFIFQQQFEYEQERQNSFPFEQLALAHYSNSKLFCDPIGIRTQIFRTGIWNSIHWTMGPVTITYIYFPTTTFRTVPIHRDIQLNCGAGQNNLIYMPTPTFRTVPMSRDIQLNYGAVYAGKNRNYLWINNCTEKESLSSLRLTFLLTR